MTVIKRNGLTVLYNPKLIEEAINKAFLEVDGQLYETDTAYDISNEITELIKKENKNVSVEQIQDWVEEKLMKSERPDVARAYIRYRYKKEVAREIKSDFFDAIKEKLEAKNVQNQNANIDEYSFGGRIGEASSVMTKRYALDNLISPMARDHHENNEIYIHDLDAYAVGSHNCLSIPFDDLLANGFNTRQTDVRPANSVNTAMQLIAVIFQLQSLQQFGGVSATHLDWTMVPYVRKSFAKHYKDGWTYIENKPVQQIDYKINQMIENSKDWSIEDKDWKAYNLRIYNYAMAMTRKEVYQAVEALYHNLNVLGRLNSNIKNIAA